LKNNLTKNNIDVIYSSTNRKKVIYGPFMAD